MAITSTEVYPRLLRRTRLELGDDGDHFRSSVHGDGETREFDLSVHRVSTAQVWVNSTELFEPAYEINHKPGILKFGTAPANGALIVVQGTYYDLFLDEQMEIFIESAATKHGHNRLPEEPLEYLLERLPPVEEHPLALLASIEALWSVLSQVTRDVNVTSPDGYTVPRSQRYQQILQTINEKTSLYEDICKQLNVGLSRIEIQQLRRVSRWTGRYVPVYRPQEVDETDPPVRVYPPRDALASSENPFAEEEDEGGEDDA